MSASAVNRANRRFYRADSIIFGNNYLDHGLSAEHENKWVFEISWEVVNKGMLYSFRKNSFISHFFPVFLQLAAFIRSFVQKQKQR